MVVLHRQQIGLARIQPPLGRAALALRAVPIAARVVRNLIQATPVAAQDMAAQCRRAALGDGRHHLELRPAQVATLGVTPDGSMGTEDVGDLQGGSRLHDGVRLQGWRLRCRFGRWFACGLGGRVIQRADDPAQQVGGHGGVQGRGVQPLVPEYTCACGFTLPRDGNACRNMVRWPWKGPGGRMTQKQGLERARKLHLKRHLGWRRWGSS